MGTAKHPACSLTGRSQNSSYQICAFQKKPRASLEAQVAYHLFSQFFHLQRAQNALQTLQGAFHPPLKCSRLWSETWQLFNRTQKSYTIV